MGPPSCVVVLAGFDGLHLGHRSLVGAAQEVAGRLGARAPVAVIVDRPEPGRAPLSTVPSRVEGLRGWGLDEVVVLTAHHDDARRLNDDVVATLGRLGTDWLVLGCPPADPGVARWPALARLRPGYAGALVELPRPAAPDGTIVSSAAVLARLDAGDVGGAATLLGRPWSLSGVVVPGDRRGRLLGFPTANVAPDGSVAVPAEGVYAGWVVRANGSRWRAAVNLGRRPTFHDGAAHSLLEAHLLDAAVDLYGERITVELVARLRGERRFEGLAELTDQLAADCHEARRRLHP